MMLLKMVKEIIMDNLNEGTSSDYQTLRKVFKYNTEKLYGYLLKRGDLDSFIDDIVKDDSDESNELMKNIIHGMISDKDIDSLYKYTLPIFSDLILNRNEIIMELGGREDLAKFFYHDSNMSEETTTSILSGEYDELFYGGYNSGKDEMFYYLSDLTEENMKLLKDYMVDEGLNKEVHYNGDNEVLENLLSEDDNILTKDCFDEIFRSENNIIDALYSIDLFENMENNVSNAYDRAQIAALETELYNNLMSSIEDFFGSKGEFKYTEKSDSYKQKYPDRSHTPTTTYVIEISEQLYIDVISWWIEEISDAGYSINYWGDFEDVLEEYCNEHLSYRDQLTYRFPDYADSKLSSDYMNDSFSDDLYY